MRVIRAFDTNSYVRAIPNRRNSHRGRIVNSWEFERLVIAVSSGDHMKTFIGAADRTLCGALLASLLALVPCPGWPSPISRVAPEEVGLSSKGLERVSRFLKDEVARGNVPGVVVLVARKGKVAYFESFGVRDPATGVPMTNDTIFRMYSMTKPFTSVAAMMLVEEGKMVLADPVSRFLPPLERLEVSVPNSDGAAAAGDYHKVPANRQVTIQDLLRHTSGFVYGDLTPNLQVRDLYAKGDIDKGDVTNAGMVQRISTVPLAFQPGTAFHYGRSTDVLGRVVEVVADTTLASFLQERIFGPLGMTDSGFHVPAKDLSRLAQPFAVSPETNRPIRLLDVSAAPKFESGGGGGVSTAADYLRFCQMLLDGGQLEGNRLLSRATIRLMTSDHLGPVLATARHVGLPPGVGFGLGFAVRSEGGEFGIAGSAGEYFWAGYSGTYFWIDPKQELIGIFMSANPGNNRRRERMVFQQLVNQSVTD
jgi:CubicO group peptidase (beta-lactamase class C family)